MGDIADYSQGEPAPLNSDGPSMHDLVKEDAKLLANNLHTENLLVDLMDERKEFGMRKYGMPLRAFNGRRPVFDLVDELGDALVYYRQIIEESEPQYRHFHKIHYAELLRITLAYCEVKQRIMMSEDNGARRS